VGSVSVATSTAPETTDEEITFGDGASPGPMTQKLYHILTGIQTGSNQEFFKKYKHWIHIVEP